MSATVVCERGFEAAHRLPHVPSGHRCARMHGHSYRCEIHVQGPVDAHTGWVVDFYQVEAALQPLLDQLDHHTLNDIPGLGNPTCEVLAAWMWRRLEAQLAGLSAVVVHETSSHRCVYTGT